MKKLFFDIQITGHHTEYISHLINYLIDNDETNEYYFVVHPNFSSEFPIISSKAKSVKNLTLVEIENRELRALQHSGMLKKSFLLYRLMHRYAIRFKVNNVCLLNFNIFQLACCFFRPSYNISGILFLQFYRMSKKTWKEKLKYYQKYFITKIYTLNPKIKKIFILNDNTTAVYLNNEFNTSIFEMLPDPIPDLKPLDDFDIYSYYNIDRKRKIFLHIGVLDDRKGTFEVIESSLFLPKEKQKEVTILLAGYASNKGTEALMFEKIATGTKNSDVKIVWDNQFVSNELMKSLFKQCYAVLMPYKKLEASSGILGHAVGANKKVIATSGGLIEDLVQENNLGMIIPKVNAKTIAEAIIKDDFKTDDKKRKFISVRNPRFFASKLITT